MIGENLHCGYYYRANDFTMVQAKEILDKLIEAGIKGEIVDRYVWAASKTKRDHARNQPPVNRSVALTMNHFIPVFVLFSILIVLVLTIALVWDSRYIIKH